MRADSDGESADDPIAARIRAILSDIDGSDFERVDPPRGLWEQIRGSITADPARPPKQAPFHGSPDSSVVEYRIDANDIVVDVGSRWADFARDNDAAELAVMSPDRVLWSYFETEAIRDLWRLLVQRVRTSQQVAEVPLRCDAPDARRWFAMTITPEANGRVHFRCVLIFEELRPPVALLDRRSERDDRLQPVALCSWCGQGQHGSRWLAVEELVHAARLLEQTALPPLAHGICGSCRDDMAAVQLVPGGVDGSGAK